MRHVRMPCKKCLEYVLSGQSICMGTKAYVRLPGPFVLEFAGLQYGKARGAWTFERGFYALGLMFFRFSVLQVRA